MYYPLILILNLVEAHRTWLRKDVRRSVIQLIVVYSVPFLLPENPEKNLAIAIFIVVAWFVIAFGMLFAGIELYRHLTKKNN